MRPFCRKNKYYRSIRGLSLVELLVAVSIATLIGFGIYKSFVNGVTVWRWIEFHKPKADAAIFFDDLAQDVGNCCLYSDSKFDGKPQSISFYVQDSDYLIFSKKESFTIEEKNKRSIFKVKYIYFPGKKRIEKKHYRIGKDYEFSTISVLDNVGSLSFTYYYRDPGKDSVTKVNTTEVKAPDALEVVVRFDGGNINRNTFSAIIPININ